MSGISFDSTLSLSAIMNALVLFIGFVVTFTRIGGRIDLLAYRLGSIEDSLKHTQDMDTRITRVEERVTNHGRSLSTIQEELTDLRRGKGWIISSPRTTVDGEY